MLIIITPIQDLLIEFKPQLLNYYPPPPAAAAATEERGEKPLPLRGGGRE
jgi:hypothetical protein